MLVTPGGCGFDASLTPRPCPGCRQVALEFAAFIQRCCSNRHIPVLVAHNGCGFDFPFLVQEYRRVGLEVPLQWPYLDTVQLARHYRGMRKNGLVRQRCDEGCSHGGTWLSESRCRHAWAGLLESTCIPARPLEGGRWRGETRRGLTLCALHCLLTGVECLGESNL